MENRELSLPTKSVSETEIDEAFSNVYVSNQPQLTETTLSDSSDSVLALSVFKSSEGLVSPGNSGNVRRVVPEDILQSKHQDEQRHVQQQQQHMTREVKEEQAEEKSTGSQCNIKEGNNESSIESHVRSNPLGRKKHPCVVLSNVHKTYLLGLEGVAAIRGVSLTVESGEFIMLLGKSGSGKTSLLNLIGTIDRPTRGDIRICDTYIRPSTSDQQLARLRLLRLGFVFQTFNLIPSMSALDNVALPMLLNGNMNRQHAYQRAEKLLADVGMADRSGHRPSQLSGGEQQRVTIARALSNEPDILLLDEPTGDLDSVNTANVMSILTKLNVEMGVSMIMVTHDPHLRAFAHRAVHMLDGKIVRSEKIPHSVRARLFRENGIEYLLYPKRATSDKDLEAQMHSDTAETKNGSEKKKQSLSLDQCRNTVIRPPSHYGAILGKSNKVKY